MTNSSTTVARGGFRTPPMRVAPTGAVSGATLGLGGRYARAGLRGAGRYMGGGGAASYGGLARSMGGGMSRRVSRDYRGAIMRANRGFNAFYARAGGGMRGAGYGGYGGMA